MATNTVGLEFVEYRVVLIDPDSRALLAVVTAGGCHLPRVRIPKGTRPVEQLRQVIRSRWGVHLLILDFVIADHTSTPLVIAELLPPATSRHLGSIIPSQLSPSQLTEQEHSALHSVVEGKSTSPFTRIGWLDEAVAWIETATGHKLSQKSDIEQLNAGGAFALVRFSADDDWSCWMKATGKPNAHELSLTSLLSRRCRTYVPDLLATKPEWNAWVVAEEGTGITGLPASPFELFRLLEDAVGSLAELQIRTIGAETELLAAGAFDQRLDTLLSRSEDLFDCLDEAMDVADSNDLPWLEKGRPRQIRIAFQMLCARMQHLHVPETVLHGDMNPGNIVIAGERCQFIDWSEAYVGPCFVTLEHLLLLLNTIQDVGTRAFMMASLRRRYASVVAAVCSPDKIEEGFRYMPLIAAVSTLYGRGDWLNGPERYDRRRLSYLRTVAAHMYRAMRQPELQDALRTYGLHRSA